MATAITAQIASLQATANTRRCHNRFFQQEQLKSIHDTLRSKSSEIISAIQKDGNVTQAEATAEFALVLSIIKEYYGEIDLSKNRHDLGRRATGKGVDQRRTPYGVVYIEPNLRHTPFFSIVVALSAAIAAGNCVALKLEANLRTLPSLLRDLLPQALTTDVFALLQSDPSPESLNDCLQLHQEALDGPLSHSQIMIPQGNVIAIVDRTADLALAAQYLVKARFAFGGASPYAPDLVLVNEFVKQEFTEQVLQQTIRFVASSSTNPTKSEGNIETSLNDENWETKVITKGALGSVVELIPRSVKQILLPTKQTNPVFTISAFTSLDHAIYIASALDKKPALAAYHFAAPAHANYLSQFINSEITITNQVPSRLLFGPAAPAFQPFDLEKRYLVEHFSHVRSTLTATIDEQSTFPSEKDAKSLLGTATKEIEVKERPEWIAHGFFEQGIFIGLGVYGLPLLTCLGTGLFYGIRSSMRYLSKFG